MNEVDRHGDTFFFIDLDRNASIIRLRTCMKEIQVKLPFSYNGKGNGQQVMLRSSRS